MKTWSWPDFWYLCAIGIKKVSWWVNLILYLFRKLVFPALKLTADFKLHQNSQWHHCWLLEYSTSYPATLDLLSMSSTALKISTSLDRFSLSLPNDASLVWSHFHKQASSIEQIGVCISILHRISYALGDRFQFDYGSSRPPSATCSKGFLQDRLGPCYVTDLSVTELHSKPQRLVWGFE